MAGRVHMSTMRDGRGPLAGVAGPPRVPRVRGADVRGGRDHLSSHPKSTPNLVHGGMADHQPEIRSKRTGPPAKSRSEKLPDRVGADYVVAGNPEGDPTTTYGTAWS